MRSRSYRYWIAVENNWYAIAEGALTGLVSLVSPIPLPYPIPSNIFLCCFYFFANVFASGRIVSEVLLGFPQYQINDSRRAILIRK